MTDSSSRKRTAKAPSTSKTPSKAASRPGPKRPRRAAASRDARAGADDGGRARGRGEPYRRIVKTALELAEAGGFEAVRLRDVAAHAEVALGTLYRRFRSKEDLLVAALEIEAEQLESRLAKNPASGATELERITEFFAIVTRVMLRKPNLTRAVLRAVASGDPELTKRVADFHGRVTFQLMRAIHGPEGGQDAGSASDLVFDMSERESRLAFLLQQIWFAALVGWAGGLHGQPMVIEQMRFAAELLLKGAEGPDGAGADPANDAPSGVSSSGA